MAKNSRRHSSRRGRLKTGCISGLMSLFDFRQGRINRRLISDGRLSFKQSVGVGNQSGRTVGVEGCTNTEDPKENEIQSTDMARASVKELIEEEMLNDSEIIGRQISSDVDTNLGSNQSIQKKFGFKSISELEAARCLLEEIGIISDLKTSDKLDPETVMEHLSGIDPECLSKNEILGVLNMSTQADQKALAAVKLRIEQKLNGISNCKKQTPSCLPAAEFLGEKPVSIEFDGCISNKNRNFFRRRSKTLESFTCLAETKSPEADIVVSTSSLSPPSLMQNDRSTSSRFSFTEIKRRIWHAIGKEKLMVSDKLILQFSPKSQTRRTNARCSSRENFGWSSPNRNHFYTEKFTLPSPCRNDRRMTMGDGSRYRGLGGFNIYIEAKKHLSEMLKNNTEGSSDSVTSQLPKTLGGILSLPVYTKSPLCSPKKFETGIQLSPSCNAQSTLIGLLQEDQENYSQDLKSQPYETGDGDSGDINKLISPETRSFDPKSEICEDIEEPELEEGKNCNVSCESCNSSMDGDIDIREASDDDSSRQSFESTECLKSEELDDHMFSSPAISTLQSPVRREMEDFDHSRDKIERPSPVSVLDPLFIDDASSPASSISETVKEIQPRYMSFDEHSTAKDQGICTRISMEDEESPFEYVEAVLLGSGLDWTEFRMRWLSSQQILDSTLFDEVEVFSSQPHNEQRLLFDCANEALLGICEIYFGYSTAAKAKVEPIPRSIDLINDVWKHVEWNLFQQVQGYSQDQLVAIDLGRTGKWMNLQPVIEFMGFEIEETIFDELLEEQMCSECFVE